MAAPARLMATGLTTTISVCSLSRRTIFERARSRPAVTSSERYASSRSQKQRSWAGTKGSHGQYKLPQITICVCERPDSWGRVVVHSWRCSLMPGPLSSRSASASSISRRRRWISSRSCAPGLSCSRSNSRRRCASSLARLVINNPNRPIIKSLQS